MTKEKELGYELTNIMWRNLDGFQEIWNKSSTEVKDKIVNETGELSYKLLTPYWKDDTSGFQGNNETDGLSGFRG